MSVIVWEEQYASQEKQNLCGSGLNDVVPFVFTIDGVPAKCPALCTDYSNFSGGKPKIFALFAVHDLTHAPSRFIIEYSRRDCLHKIPKFAQNLHYIHARFA
jgi:hypothetical protein